MTSTRKISVLIFLLILSLRGFAQNYEPVISEKEYLYSVSANSTLNKPFNSSDGTSLVGIRVRKDTKIGLRKFYFFNLHIRNGCDSISCFGKKELVEEGRCVFFNAKGDSIIVKNNQQKGSTWPIYTYTDGSYLEGSITAIEAKTVLKYTDTVKFISLTYKDKAGNNLPHIFNNKIFILGKNLGFIRTYDLAAFPADTNALRLVGISSPVLGIQNIKEKDIFDFEVGDEFHYQVESRVDWPSSSHPGSFTTYRYADVILSKTISANGDTLTYKIAQRFSGGRDTTTLKIVLNPSRDYSIQSQQFNTIPFEGLSSSVFSHSELFLKEVTTYKTLSNYYTKMGRPSDGCYQQLIGRGIFYDYTYAAGRGMVSLEGDVQTSTQIYYKKKNIEWGTPIIFPKLVGNEAPIEISRSIEISPNPASDFVSIKSKSERFIEAISISNLLGNEMMKQEIPPNTFEAKIDVSSLSNGIYLLRTKNGSREHVNRFVVTR